MADEADTSPRGEAELRGDKMTSDASSSKSEETAKPHDEDRKEFAILEACKRRDVVSLQELAVSQGGFLNDEVRQEAWPVLLGMPVKRPNGSQQAAWDDYLHKEDLSWRELPSHQDEAQVYLDANRAFVYYPDHESEMARADQIERLSNLIISVLRRHKYLHYFQGFHDIAQVFFLVLPTALQEPAVSRLSILRIRDFMLPNLDAAISQLHLIPAILHAVDPELWAHLSQTEPFFALGGTLTMYAHDIQSLGEITRIFDVLLAREPVFSVYMFAQIVLNRRAELFETPPSEPEMLHSILCKLPQPLDLESLIQKTARLCERYPPEALGRAWDAGISEYSVLKTARSTLECAGQSESVGRYYFSQHVLELERQKRREELVRRLWAYRRPAGAIGFAVLFGVLAYWMRRSPLFSSAGAGALAGPLRYINAALSRWWRREF